MHTHVLRYFATRARGELLKQYPCLLDRIEKADRLVCQERVHIIDAESAYVQGDSGQQYHVNGLCTCPYGIHHASIENPCSHMLAVQITRQAMAAAEDTHVEAYWAEYSGPETRGKTVHGTVEIVHDGCAFFRPDSERLGWYVSLEEVLRLGHIHTAQAQWERDGNLVDLICNRR